MATKKRGRGRPRLSAAQKAYNKAENKQIRKVWNKVSKNIETERVSLSLKLSKTADENRRLEELNKKTYKTFKEQVKLIKHSTKERMTTKQAAKQVVKSTWITPVNSRLVQNAVRALRTKYIGEYNKILNFLKGKDGKKPDLERMLSWDSSSRAYKATNRETGNTITVSFINSPDMAVTAVEGSKGELDLL